MTGTTRLLEKQKELMFSLSTLSSCRELPVFLSINKLIIPPKILNKSPPQLDNKVHISHVLFENFSSKKEIHTKLWLLTPLSAIPTWLIPRDSILTGQHYGYDSEPYKLDLIREYVAS